RQAEVTAAQQLESRGGVAVLHPPAPAGLGGRRRDRLTGEVEVQRPRDIEAFAAHEEAERGADPRVDVEHLVALVASVEPEAHVDDAAIAEPLEERDR